MAKGQVRLRREVLQHLGVRPGDQLSVDLLNDHRIQLRPKPGKPVSTIVGLLEQSNKERLTIEESEDEGIVKGRDPMAELVRKGGLKTDIKGGGCRCPINSLIGWLETGRHEPRSAFPKLSAGSASPKGSAAAPC